VTDQQRESVLNEASSAAIALDDQLNKLMDCYDLFIDTCIPGISVDDYMMMELIASIEALSILPGLIAEELSAWKSHHANMYIMDFDLEVVNELAIHMNSIVYFLKMQNASIDGYSQKTVDISLMVIRTANQLLGLVKV